MATTLRQPAGPSRGSSSTVAPERARPLGRLGDLGDLDVRQPERALGLALDDAAADPAAQLERQYEPQPASIRSGRQPQSRA